METKKHIVLSEMSRKNAFIVPDGYFEELPTAVLLKCSGSEVKKKQFSASKSLWWSVAACSLLLLGIWFVVPNSTPSSGSSLLSEIFHSENHLQDYLARHVDPNFLENELSFSDFEISEYQEFTQDEALTYLDHFDLTYEDLLNE